MKASLFNHSRKLAYGLLALLLAACGGQSTPALPTLMMLEGTTISAGSTPAALDPIAMTAQAAAEATTEATAEATAEATSEAGAATPNPQDPINLPSATPGTPALPEPAATSTLPIPAAGEITYLDLLSLEVGSQFTWVARVAADQPDPASATWLVDAEGNNVIISAPLAVFAPYGTTDALRVSGILQTLPDDDQPHPVMSINSVALAVARPTATPLIFVTATPEPTQALTEQDEALTSAAEALFTQPLAALKIRPNATALQVYDDLAAALKEPAADWLLLTGNAATGWLVALAAGADQLPVVLNVAANGQVRAAATFPALYANPERLQPLTRADLKIDNTDVYRIARQNRLETENAMTVLVLLALAADEPQWHIWAQGTNAMQIDAITGAVLPGS